MSSRAAKLKAHRAKRGRPLKEDVARTDSGAISRSKHPAESADKVAREARMRHFGIAAKHASTAEASTVMGRLSLLGQEGGGISVDQYEALKRYATTREHYMISIMAPDSLRSKGNSGPSSFDELRDTETKARLKRQYDSARSAIQSAQNEHRNSNLWAAVQQIVINDMDFAYMIGDLRLVGNALLRHYQGLDRKAQISHFPAQIVASTY
jgi:hypothetical protein